MHGTIGLETASALLKNAPTQKEMNKPTLPTFQPRWWFRLGRLDARPVIWSIYNHPEEWRPTRFCMLHLPSQHEFWVSGTCHLYRANCGCDSNGGKFQHFQQLAFKRAVRWWQNQQMNNDRFADHFVH